MKRVVIIGAGFSGISASGLLGRHRKEVEVKVIDKSRCFNFLPLLPDVLGRALKPELLEWDLRGLAAYGVEFINREVLGVDAEKKELRTSSGPLSYDYLVIACGSETNFYGNDALRKSSLKMDNTFDAREILSALEKDDYSSLVIAGGGYTGIEIASNLRLYLERRKSRKRIILVERAPQILGPLPSWMRGYVLENLSRQRIDVLASTSIEKIEDGVVYLTSGVKLEKGLVIWGAGVKAPDFLAGLKAERSPQGRIKVDAYLRLDESCFVLGDAAYFQHRGSFLRMAVQFSIVQGYTAAENILRQIRRKPLKEYRPRDLGYIIPMANNRSCGEVFGVRVSGALATFLHYCMCIYRSAGLKNRSGLFFSLLKGGGR